MTYVNGRIVTYAYGTGALVDRVQGITVKKYVDNVGGLVDQPLIDQVKWEPYAGLQSYRMLYEGGTNATVDYRLGANTKQDCASAETPPPTNDQTGRLYSILVASGSCTSQFGLA